MRPGVEGSDNDLMRSILQRIATGPELSKNISRDEAHRAMRLILDEQVDPVQAGVFLIALRMKRETDEEMLGLLDALREATHTVIAPVDELIDLGDPYDGFARTLPIAAFLPALLAACGVPTLSHGVESMGPKYGVTHRQVLRAAGLPVDSTVEQGAARLADPAVGWTYLDQSAFCPKLYRLRRLRSLIVKRPALTTLDVMLGPVRARRRTHFVTGYVHKAYPRIYALLARAAGFDSTLLVRGVEGGVIPSLRQEGKYFRSDAHQAEREYRMTPADLGLAAPLLPLDASNGAGRDENSDRAAVDHDALALATVDAGRRALEGEPGAARENLVAGAALYLHHLGRHPTLHDAAAAVRAVLDSGTAARRLR